MNESTSILPQETIISKIYMIRGKKVMLDEDLAQLYGVETKVLNQAVKRNLYRFQEDFMFQSAENEEEALRSQFVTSKKDTQLIFQYLKELLNPPQEERAPIGFRQN